MKDEKRKKYLFCLGQNYHRRKRVSHECGLKLTGLNSTSLKWMWSQMSGLKWGVPNEWMNVVSNERSQMRGPKWVVSNEWSQMSGLKWVVLIEVVSNGVVIIVCTPVGLLVTRNLSSNYVTSNLSRYMTNTTCHVTTSTRYELVWDFPGFSMIYFNKLANDVKFLGSNSIISRKTANFDAKF